jgi:hypothetical protein
MARNKSSSALLAAYHASQFQLDEDDGDEEEGYHGDDTCSLSSVSCDDFSMDGEEEGEREGEGDGDSSAYSYSRVADGMDGIRIVSPVTTNTTAVAASMMPLGLSNPAPPSRAAPAVPTRHGGHNPGQQQTTRESVSPHGMWQSVPLHASRPTAQPVSRAHDPFNVHRPSVPASPQTTRHVAPPQPRSHAVTTQQPLGSPQPYSFKGYKAHYGPGGNRGVGSAPPVPVSAVGDGQDSNFRLLSTAELEQELVVCGGYFMGGQPI